jgi:hypothetical protein
MIYAYKNSETFRKAVDTSWDAIKTVVMTGVRLVVGYYLWFAGMIVDAAAAAFGWIPGIGPKLKDPPKRRSIGSGQRQRGPGWDQRQDGTRQHRHPRRGDQGQGRLP